MKYEFEIRGEFYVDDASSLRLRLDHLVGAVDIITHRWDGRVISHQVAIPGKLQEKPVKEPEVIVRDISRKSSGGIEIMLEVSG